MVQNTGFYGNFVVMSDRKPFKKTKVGQWLSTNSPAILDAVGDVLPDKGVLGVVKNLIDREPDLTFEQKLEINKIISEEAKEYERNISDRWKYDMSSTSWLSKNIRPLTLLSLLIFLYVFIILDALEIGFDIKDIWIRLYETVLITAIGGYFVVRSVDKNKLPWQK